MPCVQRRGLAALCVLAFWVVDGRTGRSEIEVIYPSREYQHGNANQGRTL